MFFLTFKAKKIYSNIQFHAKFVFLDFTHAENENTPPLKGSDKTTDEVCGNNNWTYEVSGNIICNYVSNHRRLVVVQ